MGTSLYIQLLGDSVGTSLYIQLLGDSVGPVYTYSCLVIVWDQFIHTAAR